MLSTKTSATTADRNVVIFVNISSVNEVLPVKFYMPSAEAASLCSSSISVDVTSSSWVDLAMSLSKYKPRVLVTAPSNVAVDNILCRLIEKVFLQYVCC